MFLSGTEILGSFPAQPASMVVECCKIQLHSIDYYTAMGAPIFKIPALLGLHNLEATTRWCKLRKFTS